MAMDKGAEDGSTGAGKKLGALTGIFRIYGNSPEGVSYAILCNFLQLSVLDFLLDFCTFRSGQLSNTKTKSVDF